MFLEIPPGALKCTKKLSRNKIKVVRNVASNMIKVVIEICFISSDKALSVPWIRCHLVGQITELMFPFNSLWPYGTGILGLCSGPILYLWTSKVLAQWGKTLHIFSHWSRPSSAINDSSVIMIWINADLWYIEAPWIPGIHMRVVSQQNLKISMNKIRL